MKGKVEEYDELFWITFEPEDIEDAALLVRLGMNSKKAVRCVCTEALRNNKIHTSIGILKYKRASATIPKNK